MAARIKHDYALIAELVAEEPYSTYPELAAEYTRRSRIHITNTVMKATVQRRQATREMKKSAPRGRTRIYDYEVIEWLIEEKPRLATCPTDLMWAYNGLTGKKMSLSNMGNILRARRERLAREEAARNGQVESEDSDQRSDNSSDRSDSAL